MAYNNVPLHVKNFETVVFLCYVLKCWEGEKKSKCFIAIAEQREKFWGLSWAFVGIEYSWHPVFVFNYIC